ncbi:UNVERIFIED_CONTAM: Immune-associated nucleotide-binding protein 9 [Sesamum radiatum]|uniref:Immune-associated nucleotide-binding protein 9 n=1 Tax=Sesamum radiatum TaxID=300843 RepID=A0AAW2M8G1_SESRA
MVSICCSCVLSVDLVFHEKKKLLLRACGEFFLSEPQESQCLEQTYTDDLTGWSTETAADQTARVEAQATTHRLGQQLAEEQAARLKAESMAQAAQKESDDEIRKLREHLERAHRENEEFRKQAESGKCVIL